MLVNKVLQQLVVLIRRGFLTRVDTTSRQAFTRCFVRLMPTALISVRIVRLQSGASEVLLMNEKRYYR